MSEITHCRSCGAPVVFQLTAKNRLCPFDVVDGKVTTTSHFTTCNDPKGWSRKRRRRE